MSLEDKIRSKFGKEKIKAIPIIKRKTLQPPKIPKIPKIIKKEEKIEEQEGLGIIQQIARELVSDWDFLKGLGRAIKKVFPNQLKGINLRTSNKKIVEQFDERIKKINKEYDIIEKLKRQKKGDFVGVIDEFKNKIAKIREVKKNK